MVMMKEKKKKEEEEEEEEGKKGQDAMKRNLDFEIEPKNETYLQVLVRFDMHTDCILISIGGRGWDGKEMGREKARGDGIDILIREKREGCR